MLVSRKWWQLKKNNPSTDLWNFTSPEEVGILQNNLQEDRPKHCSLRKKHRDSHLKGREKERESRHTSV